MKKLLSIKGFTLIELLVVITIIGILATGATTIYTSAQQKARDSIRQTDLLSVKSAVEQSYGDKGAYPMPALVYNALVTGGYLASLPRDPKTGQNDGDTLFSYLYGASLDEANAVAGQEYELSANYENSGNAESKEISTADSGNDDERWEIGVNMDHVNTTADTTDATGINGWATAADGDGDAVILDTATSS